MLSLIVYALPYILGIVLLIALVSSFSSFRRARKAPYFRIRRDATQAAWRWVLVLLVCTGGLYGALRARQMLTPPDMASLWPSPPTVTPTFSLLEAATPTLDPNATPKEPLLGPPTITPTQPTAPPTPNPPLATHQTDVTPPAGAEITITAIARGMTTERIPVEPGTKFPVGIAKIYVFYKYANMANGLSWGLALLRNGAVVRTEPALWKYGETGTGYYQFPAQGGFPAGNYQVQFFIGEKMVAQGAFTIE